MIQGDAISRKPWFNKQHNSLGCKLADNVRLLSGPSIRHCVETSKTKEPRRSGTIITCQKRDGSSPMGLQEPLNVYAFWDVDNLRPKLSMVARDVGTLRSALTSYGKVHIRTSNKYDLPCFHSMCIKSCEGRIVDAQQQAKFRSFFLRPEKICHVNSCMHCSWKFLYAL